MQGKRKTCCICPTSFIPHRKLGDRQKTCGDPECQRTNKRNNDARWRRNNSKCTQNDYPRVKAWLDEHSGYLKQYRQDHPEYIQKNRAAQKRRDRQRKVRLDIQAKLNRQPSEIVEQSKRISTVSHLDIQDEFILKPLEITFILSRLIHFPCLAIQAEMDFSSPLRDNGAIKHGGDAYGCKMARRS